MFVLQRLFVLFAYFCITSASCPNVIGRVDWGAAPAVTSPEGVYPATHVVLHHSSTPTCDSAVNCKALVRSIQKHHMHRKRYDDVGYNFLIGEDGNVYEGVGWGKQGTHDERLNSKSMGICIIGDYTSWLPNNKALSALESLMDCGVQYGHLIPNYKLMAHRQLKQTECPGNKLYFHIRRWPNWSHAP